MKIGIISMQRITNYGSFLQAYGLMNEIKKLGHSVEFIDYKVNPCIVKSVTNNKKVKKTTNVIEKIYRLRNAIACKRYHLAFDQHKQFFQRYSTEYMRWLGIGQEQKLNSKVDILVIGSDEVFNCLQTNKNVGYSLELFGKNANASKIISYAASFGNTTIKGLKKYGVDHEIAEMLCKFSAISVRDNNSYDIVKELVGITPEKHLDPVLIYDFNREVSECKAKKPFSKYIVVYAYAGRISKEEGRIISRFAKKKGAKLVAIGGEHSFCDVSIYPTPFEVLKIVKNADYVITDTFHGTVFSIKYNKKFATIVRSGQEQTYGNSEKLRDLLLTFKLENREVKNIEGLENILEKDISYDSVNEIIIQQREKTRMYLNTFLNI